MTSKILGQGAEAIVEQIDGKTVRKTRPKKQYRLPALDNMLRKLRTRSEAKILQLLAKNGIAVPKTSHVDDQNMTLDMSFLEGNKLRDVLSSANVGPLCTQLGCLLASMHNLDVIHSDLTTSNMIVHSHQIYLIDFGLSFISRRAEDKAVDLHLLKQALHSYHYLIADEAFKSVVVAYSEHIKDTEVLDRLKIVERRGKNKQ